MKHKILTMDDLYNFCRKTNFSSFCSSDSGYELVVHTFGKTSVFDASSDGKLPVHFQACHTGENLNKSSISDDNMKKALPSLSLRPILANIIETEDGYDFNSHDMTFNDDGSVDYIEKPVGVIKEESNAKLVYDENKNKKYVEVDGIIYEEYSRAAEILKKRGQCDVSVEICIKEMKFNTDTKVLDILDFYFNGITLLGKHVKPGMDGSNVKIEDFSESRNSIVYKCKVKQGYQIDDACNAKEDNLCESNEILNRQSVQMEGGFGEMKLEDLLKKYNVKAEDIKFDYQSLSDEELEQKFESEFGSKDESDDGENPQDENPEKTLFTIEFGSLKFSKEISMNDIVSKMYKLVNDTYGEADDTFYDVTVYDSDVLMVGYYTGKSYKQSYVIDGDECSLRGDRVEVFCHYLTKEEEDYLDGIKNEYPILKKYREDSEKQKDDEEKKSVFADTRFSIIESQDEYKQLFDNRDKYSKDELLKELKVLYAEYKLKNEDKESESNDAKKHNNGNHVKVMLQKPDKKKPYGSLFKD